MREKEKNLCDLGAPLLGASLTVHLARDFLLHIFLEAIPFSSWLKVAMKLLSIFGIEAQGCQVT